MFSSQGPVPGGLCPAFGRTRCGRRPAGKGSPGVEQPEGFPQKGAWLLGAFKPWVNTAYHIWMTTGSDFYERVGYDFARFDDTGYTNMALHGEEL